jgi:polyferredoxin
MPRKVSKKEKEQSNFLKYTSMAIIVIGVLILLATALTWQPYEVSPLATRVNLLTLLIGILYLLFGYVLFKAKF